MNSRNDADPPGAGNQLFSGFMEVFSGISHGVGVSNVWTVDGTTPRIQRVNAFRIDLTAAGIDFITTPIVSGSGAPSGNGYTIGDTVTGFMAANAGVKVAINANFTYCAGMNDAVGASYGILGYVVSQGIVVYDPTMAGWDPSGGWLSGADVASATDAGSQALIITRQSNGFSASIEPAYQGVSLPSAYCAVAGSPQPQGSSPYAPQPYVPGPPQLVVGGVNMAYGFSGIKREVAARTAIGIDSTGTKLFLVVLDGCENNSPAYGGDFCDIAQWLITVGASDGINVDGGGSAIAAMRTSTLDLSSGTAAYDLNDPSVISIPYGNELGGRPACQRPVGVFLGVIADDLTS